MTMRSHALTRFIRRALTLAATAVCVAACGTPSTLSAEHLASIGVIEGASYWEAEQKLAMEGYRCFVAGAKRENFDCTKTTGFFPTCLLRVTFEADDDNRVVHLRVADPACLGTP